MSDEKERPTAAENPSFLCKKCLSNDVWYTTGETWDGAYDTYNYRCHSCGYRWRVVSEID